jgi:hypothetical protein
MQADRSIAQLLVLIFLAIFAFNFRESIKAAQAWGAFRLDQFQWKKSDLLLKLTFSLLTLTVLPLLAVAPFWKTVDILAASDPCPAVLETLWKAAWLQRLEPFCGTFVAFVYVVIMGFFSRGAKHVWLTIARTRGWVQTQSSIRPVVYSLQVIFMCFVLPIPLFVWFVPNESLWILDRGFWSRLFVVTYTAELITLVQIGVGRAHFETKDHWLFSVRWVISFLYTVLFPLAFGAFALTLINGNRSGGRLASAWVFPQLSSVPSSLVSFVSLLVFLSVPYGFNQTYLLRARKWSSPEEIRLGSTQWWRFCFVFIIVPAFVASCIWFYF